MPNEQHTNHSPEQPLPFSLPENMQENIWRRHPLLTPEQERLIFAALREYDARNAETPADYTVHQLCNDTDLIETIQQTSQDHQTLWVHVLTHTQTVRDLLAACYDSYAWRMTLDFRGLPYGLDDKVAAARRGLVDAIDAFDPNRGASFTTYARYPMRAAMQNEMCHQYGITRTDWVRLSVIRSISSTYFDVFHRYPSRDQLMAQLMANADGKEGRPYVPLRNMDGYVDLHYAILQRLHRTEEVPTDTLREQENARPEERALGTYALPSAEDAVIQQETSAMVARAMRELPEVGRTLIERVFGFYGPEMSVADAAQELGISLVDAESYFIGSLAYLRSSPQVNEVRPITAQERHATRVSVENRPEERRPLYRLSTQELFSVLSGYNASLQETVHLAWQGLTAMQIAAQRGVSREAVYQLLRKFEREQNITAIPDTKRRRQAQATEMFIEGQDVAKIAPVLGMSRPVIVNYLIASGVMPSPKEQAEKRRVAADSPEVLPVREAMMREQNARRERRP